MQRHILKSSGTALGWSDSHLRENAVPEGKCCNREGVLIEGSWNVSNFIVLNFTSYRWKLPNIDDPEIIMPYVT